MRKNEILLVDLSKEYLMKIVTIVGARPQFIKAAAVSRKLRKSHTEILVHTGQHYDTNMSDIFFKELQIPKPDYNLGVGSGSHAKQTADIMVGIEKILLDEKPNYIMVYGDTNSTLAGALAASKILIPIIHVEAGLRSFNKAMPEEQNRVLADHLSELLFCPTEVAVQHLKKEGISKNVYLVGDVMCDAVQYYLKNMKQHNKQYFFEKLIGLYEPIVPLKKWYLATIHRAENTNTKEKIAEILAAFESFTAPVIFPVHPRTKPIIDHLIKKHSYKNIMFVEPIGYLEMLYFTQNAVKVVTDSGGLQKEAYILNTDTVTIREQTEWVETLKGNYNVLCKPNREDIIEKVYHIEISKDKRQALYGDGYAAEKICKILAETKIK